MNTPKIQKHQFNIPNSKTPTPHWITQNFPSQAQEKAGLLPPCSWLRETGEVEHKYAASAAMFTLVVAVCTYTHIFVLFLSELYWVKMYWVILDMKRKQNCQRNWENIILVLEITVGNCGNI